MAGTFHSSIFYVRTDQQAIRAGLVQHHSGLLTRRNFGSEAPPTMRQNDDLLFAQISQGYFGPPKKSQGTVEKGSFPSKS
jgi:hypothetical protein